MPDHPVVSREEWLAAREQLLEKEKAFTRERDRLSRERRSLPWVRVEKDYRFDGPDGIQSLGDLFEGRHQLLVQHFMFGPDWTAGCPSCSFWTDNFDGIDVHLAERDITFALVSRAPLAALTDYRDRLGWRVRWYSSLDSDFNHDFHVSFADPDGEVYYNYRNTRFPSEEAPGMSAFYRDDSGEIFHTYSCYARGLDILNGAYHLMDIAPMGRDEDDLPFSMAWVRRRDEY